MEFVEIVTILFQATYLIKKKMLVSREKILDFQTLNLGFLKAQFLDLYCLFFVLMT